MHIRRTQALSIAILLSVLAFVPSGLRTLPWASNASGLITLAMTPEKDHSFNPFNGDSVLVSPEMAVWILESFEWPYRRNDNSEMPLLHSAITARGLVGSAPEDRDRMMSLVETMVSRGEDLDQYWDYYTPLHMAVMYCEPEIVRLLLESGADAELPFIKTGSPAEGLNPLEFSRFLRGQNDRWQCDVDITSIIAG